MKYLSNCCSAGFEAVGRTTMYHKCLECGKPCDIVEQDKSLVNRELEVGTEPSTKLPKQLIGDK